MIVKVIGEIPFEFRTLPAQRLLVRLLGISCVFLHMLQTEGPKLQQGHRGLL